MQLVLSQQLEPTEQKSPGPRIDFKTSPRLGERSTDWDNQSVDQMDKQLPRVSIVYTAGVRSAVLIIRDTLSPEAECNSQPLGDWWPAEGAKVLIVMHHTKF